MPTIQNISTQTGGLETFEIDTFPDHCPICHAGIHPIDRKTAHYDATHKRLELVFRCPRDRCQALFISRYGMNYGMYSPSMMLTGSYPFEPFDVDYPEHVTKISPRFCEIANEAQKAEGEKWKLIAGPGYRKALEFLVKDYLCKELPDEAENIKKLLLGSCIEKYVTNTNVKKMAARAAWIGNDETHYVRKWEDKDLEDLKKLIALTVHWIEMEAMTASVLVEMPEGKK